MKFTFRPTIHIEADSILGAHNIWDKVRSSDIAFTGMNLPKPEKSSKANTMIVEPPRPATICGHWVPADKQSECFKCKAPTIETPREGHPNSKYWGKEQDDGLVLKHCSKGCPE